MKNEIIEEFDYDTAIAADMDPYEMYDSPNTIWDDIRDSVRDVFKLFGGDEYEDEEDEFFWDDDWKE